MAKVIDHKGWLAIAIGGWIASQTEPQEELWIELSKIPFASYSFLDGYTLQFQGDIGFCFYERKRYTFDCRDKSIWKRITLTRPVKKPRRGKRLGERYDWEWIDGSWRRKWIEEEIE